MRKKSYLELLAVAISCLTGMQAALFAGAKPELDFQGDVKYMEKGWVFWRDNLPGAGGVTGATGATGTTGATGERGRPGRSGFANALKYDLFVDANQNVTTPNGSIGMPFNTISAAIASIQTLVQNSSAERQNMFTILVAGGIYDKEPDNTLRISGDGLRINLVALGEVYIGTDANQIPVVWEIHGSDSAQALPMLSFSTLSQSAGMAGGKFIIPGGISVGNLAPALLDVSATLGVIFSNSEVPFDLYMNNCQMCGNIQAPNANLQVADKVSFRGSVQIGSYGSIRACDIQFGMDIGAGFVTGNAQPQGILLSNCVGAFTSSLTQGAALNVDNYTAGAFTAVPEGAPAATVDATVQLKVIGSAS